MSPILPHLLITFRYSAAWAHPPTARALSGRASISKPPPEMIPAYTELNNSVGSYGTVKNTVNMGTGLLDGKFSFDGRLSRIYSNGYIDRALPTCNPTF
jgi:hypothetical protein